MTTINRETKTITQPSISRKWLYMTLAAAALTLGACADKEAPMTDADTTVDAQTPVEQQATGVASDDMSNDAMANDDVAVAADGMAADNNADMMNDDVASASADDGVAIDDSEILDGSEQEEHVSTY